MNPVLYKTFLYLHIAAGTLALLIGLIPLLAKKGGTLHRRTGKVYFYAMLVVAASAIFIAGLKGGWFLFCVGFFSGYLTLTGNQAYNWKKNGITVNDYAITGISLLANLGMLGMAFYMWQTQAGGMFIVLAVFGGLGISFNMGDIRFYRNHAANPKNLKQSWIFVHIPRMIGSYISAITAFTVVNVKTSLLPGYVLWLAPTVVLTPLIIYNIRKYKTLYARAADNRLKQA